MGNKGSPDTKAAIKARCRAVAGMTPRDLALKGQHKADLELIEGPLLRAVVMRGQAIERIAVALGVRHAGKAAFGIESMTDECVSMARKLRAR